MASGERPRLEELLEPFRRGVCDLAGGVPADPAGHHGGSVSVRTAAHEGHAIRIESSYRVFIDGEEFPDPIHVSDDGRVHYHGLPQYSLPSAVELLKVIVERLSTEAPPPIGDHRAGPDAGHDPGHDTGHDAGPEAAPPEHRGARP